MRSPLLALLLLVAPPASAAVTLQDVALLLPLPTSLAEGDSQGIRPTDRAGTRELLPAADFARVPTLLLGMSAEAVHASLRAVGVRLDPCFTSRIGDPCRPQIRVVWQPMHQPSEDKA